MNFLVGIAIRALRLVAQGFDRKADELSTFAAERERKRALRFVR